MRATSFHAMVIGVLCLCTAGLAAVAVNQNRQLQALQAMPRENSSASDYQGKWNELKNEQDSTGAAIKALRITSSDLLSTQNQIGQQLNQFVADLESLKQSLPKPVASVDLKPLELRLSELKEQLLQVRVQAASQPRTKAPSSHSGKPRLAPRAQIQAPPFSIMGSETRGPERFLSLVPIGEQTLRSVRLVQPGESFAGWRLENLNTGTAVFSIAGQAPHTLAIP